MGLEGTCLVFFQHLGRVWDNRTEVILMETPL